jgi:signal transduction histidine kinase
MVLLAVAAGIGLFVQRSVLLSQLDSRINDELSQEIEELRQLSGGRNPNTGEPFGGDVQAIFDTFLSRTIPGDSEAMYTLVGGQPYSSTIAPVQLLEVPEVVEQWAGVTSNTRAEIDTENGRVRYAAAPLFVNNDVAGVFVVAIFLDERRDEITDVLSTGAIVLGSTFVIASVLAWFAAGRILRPVRQLTEAARTINDSNWTERITAQGDDEIQELARTFNDMVDRLESSFATQRRFIDDAGHELRTPITIVRGHLELMQEDPAERRETMYLVMDELDRMSRMVEDLLLLARAEHPDFLDPHPLDVEELTFEIAAKAAAFGERGWEVVEAAPVVMVADRQRLTQAMMNLARNAVEHTADGTRVTIGSAVRGDEVEFWVHDDGSGIAESEREHVFERFSRGRRGRRETGGAGLGLAIAKAIVEAHDGRIDLESSPGEGTTFTLTLPADGLRRPEGR